jgi:hypothetical protein
MSFIETVRGHKQTAVKLSLFAGAFIIALFALSGWLNSNHLKTEQAAASQRAVAAHTQTLNEIKNIVTQLEKNNQTNHDTTIAYLECIVQGLISSTPGSQANAQTTFNACIAVSGLQTDATPKVP